jgi:hypothetical protein
VTEKRAPGIEKSYPREWRITTIRELPWKNKSYPGRIRAIREANKTLPKTGKNRHFDISVSSRFHTSPTELTIFVSDPITLFPQDFTHLQQSSQSSFQTRITNRL